MLQENLYLAYRLGVEDITSLIFDLLKTEKVLF